MLVSLLPFLLLSSALAGSQPHVNDVFAANRTDFCGGGFPFCPSTRVGKPFTIFHAMNAIKLMERLGPADYMPGVKQVARYDLGYNYLIHFDGNKVTKCERQKIQQKVNSTELYLGLVGFFADSTNRGNVACPTPASSSALAVDECQHWVWNHTFGVGCPHNKRYTGTEPERWFVDTHKTFPQGPQLRAMFNDIHEPACKGKPIHQFYHSNWEKQYTGKPADSLFAVPPASQCKEVPLKLLWRFSGSFA
eukprot:TRINITY_DN118817_c0_g1_i1.p1 TRINITY_DN118817_c0_g1~~TRINITY_DN118817_c0_g1_i1.p1  ORF type:complete len:249 (+),score=41.46 TRINITY_DN118817_c0_g1_i1:26-772(+)